ncbi:MAG: peptide chain release factor 1 [Candidatus Omnitrophica bacterium]|nr:peptide chain release factor 1 [Candidatus Omnitrophota bacterium]MBU2473781.1 peptide chain release factor 1 [Candidatus Omnitrophota bacterium]
MINFDKLRQEYETIAKKLSSQDSVKNRQEYTVLAKRYSYLEKLLKLSEIRQKYLQEKEHLTAITRDNSESEEMRSMAQSELGEIQIKLAKVEEEIEEKLFEGDDSDRDIIIEIRSAAGGEEAALFVGSLFKMYSRYADSKGWKQEVLSSSPTEIGGFKEVDFSLKGQKVFSRLKFESGVHRVQRVPVTEAGGRIHTSTVTVAVLVEPKEVELKINPEDLKIDTYRSSGAGGQHVNVTDSAVRITHLPSGVVVACQDERSQIKNRAKALRIIKARIMEKMLRDEADKMTQNRRIQVGTGERSEKIRTYNFPERRVTDHRINFTLYRLEEVLEGDLDEIITALVQAERKKVYEARGLT